MNKEEYSNIQNALSKKLKNPQYPTNKEEAYNEGILAAKSIISSFYKYYQKLN